MSREVRRVPVGWRHPTDANNQFVPLFDGYAEAVREWDESKADWEQREENSSSYEEAEGPRPLLAEYMPKFEGDPNAYGWCLYETISEGTPLTPVFATADELIEHLTTVGESYDHEPYRREAAETLVRQARSTGSLISLAGTVYDSARDADKIAALLRHR